MFKRKPTNLKHNLRQQHSLSSLHTTSHFKATVEAFRTFSKIPKSSRSKDSKTSLKNKKSQPQLRMSGKFTPETFGRKSEEIKPSRLKEKAEMINEYMGMGGKTKVKRETKTPMRTRGLKTYHEHSEYLNQQQLQKPQPQPTTPTIDDLICDEVLCYRQPFPLSISKTPPRFVQSTFDRYGLDLSVVEERMISQQQKQFISDKKKKTHTRMPTASTTDRTANTAKQVQKAYRSISPSPFEPNKLRKQTKISINVHNLVKKTKYTSQNTNR